MTKAVFGKCPQCRRSFSLEIPDHIISIKPKPSGVIIRKEGANHKLIDFSVHYYIQEGSRGAILKEDDTEHYMILILDEQWKQKRFYSVNSDAFISHFSKNLGFQVKNKDIEDMLDCLVLVDFDQLVNKPQIAAVTSR